MNTPSSVISGHFGHDVLLIIHSEFNQNAIFYVQASQNLSCRLIFSENAIRELRYAARRNAPTPPVTAKFPQQQWQRLPTIKAPPVGDAQHIMPKMVADVGLPGRPVVESRSMHLSEKCKEGELAASTRSRKELVLPFKENTMPIIKIDEKDYELDNLSDEAKAQLASLQFVDGELQRLNAKAAVLQTARVAYSKALNEALVANQTLN